MAVKCEWGWDGVVGLFLALDAWYKQTNSPEEKQPAKPGGWGGGAGGVECIVRIQKGTSCFLLAVLVAVSLYQMSERRAREVVQWKVHSVQLLCFSPPSCIHSIQRV